MTWYRIEGKMPRHVKYAPLSDTAAAAAGGAAKSAKKLPSGVPPTLPHGRAPALPDALPDAFFDRRVPIFCLASGEIWVLNSAGVNVTALAQMYVARKAAA